jgi:C-terminal processing protease CtpA/Prc
VIHPEGKPFHGKVYVLMDASNSSATFQFAQIIQQHKLGTLVGRPSGGNQRGINGGAFFFLRLPKSQIEIDVPLVGAFPASPQSDAGLTPDVLVTPSLQDIVEGKDVDMDRVAALRAK